MDSERLVHYNDQRTMSGRRDACALNGTIATNQHGSYVETGAAILGAGLIGRSWAMVFARAGWAVRIFDNDPVQLAAARSHVATDLAEQQAFGLIDDAARAAARIVWCERLADVLEGAHWVQENLPETVEAKRQIFSLLDSSAPAGAILASSTSAIPASRFTEAMAARARCLVAHPVNPPHLVPVVELCGAPWTAPETIARAQEVMSAIGQVPVVVRREVDGFVLNRLQGALLSEAMRLVGEGYVTPADLDKTVSEGLGLRWSFMGPFATIELNAPGGVADYCARYGSFFRRLASDPPSPAIWDEKNAHGVAAKLDAATAREGTGTRDARAAWRNRRLLALMRHKRDQKAPQ
jgi:3-hydroxyacyl-CoA dehydrogenase